MCIASIALVKMPYLLFSFILHETTLVSTNAWHHQHGNKLFSSIRRSCKVLTYYDYEKYNTIYSGSNYPKYFMAIRWRYCRTTNRRNFFSDYLYRNVYKRFKCQKT